MCSRAQDSLGINPRLDAEPTALALHSWEAPSRFLLHLTDGETDPQEGSFVCVCVGGGNRRGEVPQGAASSPTWQLPVLEGVIYLRTLGPGVALTARHHIAGKRERQWVRRGLGQYSQQ